jgi:hypothetical protein
VARKTKVTNIGSDVYSQEFNGVQYTIKPGDSIIMPRHEAVELRGHYCGKTKVQLKLEHLPWEEPVKKTTESQKVYVAPDGKEFTDKTQLQEYMARKKG